MQRSAKPRISIASSHRRSSWRIPLSVATVGPPVELLRLADAKDLLHEIRGELVGGVVGLKVMENEGK